MEPNQCPRCGEGIPNNYQRGQYPGAVSRWDNVTEICSQCGVDEAMLQFFYSKDAHVLDPVMGELKWYAVSREVPHNNNTGS